MDNAGLGLYVARKAYNAAYKNKSTNAQDDTRDECDSIMKLLKVSILTTNLNQFEIKLDELLTKTSLKTCKIGAFQIFSQRANFVFATFVQLQFSTEIWFSKEKEYLQEKLKLQRSCKNKICELRKNSKRSNFALFR